MAVDQATSGQVPSRELSDNKREADPDEGEEGGDFWGMPGSRKWPKLWAGFFQGVTTEGSWMLIARKNHNWQPAVIERDKLDEIMQISDRAQKALYQK